MSNNEINYQKSYPISAKNTLKQQLNSIILAIVAGTLELLYHILK
jgi:hypothetical protein